MKKLTLEERVHRAEGGLAAENLHARHSYLHGGTRCKEEWDEIWSRADDISWAHGFGRMRGFEEVWYNSVTTYNWRGISNYGNIFNIVPKASYLTDFRSLSEVAMHTLATDIIEVAEDGQTARGFFLTPGVLFCACNGNGHYWGGNLWERYGSDFRFEDGEWRYIHEQVCPDVGGDFDFGNEAADKYHYLLHPEDRPAGPGGPPPAEAEEGAAPGAPDPSGAEGNIAAATEDLPDIRAMLHLSDPGPLHKDWDVFQTVQNTVPWPEPYETMNNSNTYTKQPFWDD